MMIEEPAVTVDDLTKSISKEEQLNGKSKPNFCTSKANIQNTVIYIKYKADKCLEDI